MWGCASRSAAHWTSQLKTSATSATTRETAELAEALDQGAQRDDVAPGLRLGAGVRQQCGVELLAALHGRAPLEEADAVGAAGDVRRGCRGASWPGSFATLSGCQFTAPVECSMSSQGAPFARPRVVSAANASSVCGRAGGGRGSGRSR